MSTYQINFQSDTEIREAGTDNSLEVDALLLYEGDFTDAHGQKITIDHEVMSAIEYNYEMHLADDSHHAIQAIRRLFGREPKKLYKNIVLNHIKNDASKIVGKLLKVYTQTVNDKPYLLGKLLILGKENVERVRDGRYCEMSISFDYDALDKSAVLREVSYVFEPAVPNVVSFSSHDSVAPLQDTKFSVELSKCREDLNKLSGERRRIESELSKLSAHRKLSYSFGNMVKEGAISKSDFKKIMIDMQFVDGSSHEALLRAVSTVAKSKKYSRGRINSNLSASAFESFVDNIVTPTRNGGGKEMIDKKDPEQLGQMIVDHLKSGKSAVEFSAVPPDSKMKHDVKKEEAHEEKEHMIHFKKHDVHRMHEMLSKNMGHKEIMDYMCNEMGYKHEDSTHGEHHDHSATGAKNEPESPGMEYAKQVDKKITDLQAQLSKTNEFIETLTNKIVELSTPTNGGTK